jgi:hypothetical protein
MRMGLLLCLVFTLVVSSKGQQESSDPYSMKVVAGALAMRSGGRTVIISVTQKQLSRLGDGVSIALLKILDQQELIDANRVRDYLPIIRDSFAEPQLISADVDRKPKVTLFLLSYLLRNIADGQVQHEIQQTIDFVEKETGGLTHPE